MHAVVSVFPRSFFSLMTVELQRARDPYDPFEANFPFPRLKSCITTSHTLPHNSVQRNAIPPSPLSIIPKDVWTGNRTRFKKNNHNEMCAGPRIFHDDRVIDRSSTELKQTMKTKKPNSAPLIDLFYWQDLLKDFQQVHRVRHRLFNSVSDRHQHDILVRQPPKP